MTTIKRLTAAVCDLAMLELGINALAILITWVLRPPIMASMIQPFVWLLPLTALVMLIALLLAPPRDRLTQ